MQLKGTAYRSAYGARLTPPVDTADWTVPLTVPLTLETFNLAEPAGTAEIIRGVSGDIEVTLANTDPEIPNRFFTGRPYFGVHLAEDGVTIDCVGVITLAMLEDPDLPPWVKI